MKSTIRKAILFLTATILLGFVAFIILTFVIDWVITVL